MKGWLRQTASSVAGVESSSGVRGLAGDEAPLRLPSPLLHHGLFITFSPPPSPQSSPHPLSSSPHLPPPLPSACLSLNLPHSRPLSPVPTPIVLSVYIRQDHARPKCAPVRACCQALPPTCLMFLASCKTLAADQIALHIYMYCICMHSASIQPAHNLLTPKVNEQMKRFQSVILSAITAAQQEEAVW